MAFMLDPQEIKPGLVLFRRSDVQHKQWYCRIKIPNVDRYKTIALKTADINVARDRAFDKELDVRYQIKHNVPVFNKPFKDVAKEYSEYQKKRSDVGEITKKRWLNEESFINKQLNPYVGNFQITDIGEERWKAYPLWRRSGGTGRGKDQRISDWTIRSEMATFRAILLFAAGKKYTTADTKAFSMRPLKLGKPRREYFTLDEYRTLYTHARSWITCSGKGGPAEKTITNKQALWYRRMFQKFMLFMTNTGLRPPEARNLRWRDIGSQMTGRDGKPFIPIAVRGKGKHRTLVAPISVARYIEDIRALSKKTEPDDFVFTTHDGARASTLYKSLLDDILSESETGLLYSASGKRRSIYSFRHTYATFRLMHGTDPMHLAQQMGTSQKMIEDHYSHIKAVTNPDLILKGIPGWELAEDGNAAASSSVNAGGGGPQATPGKAKRHGKGLPAAGKASRSTRRR